MEKCLHSDEPKIELFGHYDKRYMYVWRSKGEAFEPENSVSTAKHGGSIMHWGWCAAGGTLHKV